MEGGNWRRTSGKILNQGGSGAGRNVELRLGHPHVVAGGWGGCQVAGKIGLGLNPLYSLKAILKLPQDSLFCYSKLAKAYF